MDASSQQFIAGYPRLKLSMKEKNTNTEKKIQEYAQKHSQEHIRETTINMSDHDLTILFNIVEDEVESTMLPLLSLISDEDINIVKKTQKRTNISYPMRFILEKLHFLLAIEKELEKRDLLDSLRKMKIYIDYKQKDFCVYRSYIFRFLNLLEMKQEGYLDSNYVDSVTEELYDNLNQELQEELQDENKTPKLLH